MMTLPSRRSAEGVSRTSIWGGNASVSVGISITDPLPTSVSLRFRNPLFGDIHATGQLSISCLNGRTAPLIPPFYVVLPPGPILPNDAIVVGASYSALGEELRYKLNAMIAGMNIGALCPAFIFLPDGGIGLLRP